MLGLTGFLGLTRIPLGFWAHTDLTDPTVLLCGWKISQMLLCVGWLARISLVFGLTQIPRYCFVGGKSHRWFCAWAGSRGFRLVFGLTRISQIPRYCFVGGKSHRWFCVWAGSHGFHFAFGLTQISQIPQYCFVGGKSHRWFCAWVA